MRIFGAIGNSLILMLLQVNFIYGQESINPNYHIVQENDNAYRISLNNKIPLDSLKLWNNLDSNYIIQVGQKLIISSPKEAYILNEATLVSGQKANLPTHIVKKNENAYRISLNNNIPLDSLKIWNNLDSNFTIEIGQELIFSQPIKESILHDTVRISLPLLSEIFKDEPRIPIIENMVSCYRGSNFFLQAFMIVNILFVISSISVILLIISIRVVKRMKRKKIDECQPRYLDFITKWAYDENNSINFNSLQFEMKNKINREVFTNQLLTLHSNLIGESADRLVVLFHKAGLKKYSIKKIHSLYWYYVVKGLKELVQMKIFDQNTYISKYLNSRNDELRIETRLAWIELNPENPIGFLNVTTIPLTEWGQLISLISLKKIDNIPDFGRWIESKNESVSIYAIKMVGILKQFENMNLLIKQLECLNERIRFQAIATLGKMAIPSPIADLQHLYHTENLKNKAEIIKSLIDISDSKNISFFRDSLISEEDKYLRILSAKGLTSLGSAGMEVIDSLEIDADAILSRILMHAKDTRI